MVMIIVILLEVHQVLESIRHCVRVCVLADDITTRAAHVREEGV